MLLSLGGLSWAKYNRVKIPKNSTSGLVLMRVSNSNSYCLCFAVRFFSKNWWNYFAGKKRTLLQTTRMLFLSKIYSSKWGFLFLSKKSALLAGTGQQSVIKLQPRKLSIKHQKNASTEKKQRKKNHMGYLQALFSWFKKIYTLIVSRYFATWWILNLKNNDHAKFQLGICLK